MERCQHAQDHGNPGAVVCGLGLHYSEFTGEAVPSLGTCKACPSNTTGGTWPVLVKGKVVRQNKAPLDPGVQAHLRRQAGGCRGCGDAPPPGME